MLCHSYYDNAHSLSYQCILSLSCRPCHPTFTAIKWNRDHHHHVRSIYSTPMSISLIRAIIMSHTDANPYHSHYLEFNSLRLLPCIITPIISQCALTVPNTMLSVPLQQCIVIRISSLSPTLNITMSYLTHWHSALSDKETRMSSHSQYQHVILTATLF